MLIADLGMRRGAKIEDVSSNSAWINGLEWMKEEVSSFPVTSFNDLKLSYQEAKEAKKRDDFSPQQGGRLD